MKSLIIVLVVLVVVGGAIFFWPSSSGDVVVDVTPTMEASPSSSMLATLPPAVPGESVVASPTKNLKEFTVIGTQFKFSLSEIKVKKGDTVKINFKNEQGTHDWTIDEFSVRTKTLKVGETESITFVASKTGTFEYYCSVGTHRQMGMKGKLIVE